jgi:hypothetical protein
MKKKPIINLSLKKKYKKKLDEYTNITISRIRIASASSLIAVYIYDIANKMTRVCFGGKHINKDDAYLIAKMFVNSLNLTNDCMQEDTYQSPQQVAAS